MTYRDMEIFIAVVECGRIGDAADKLHLAQPTVSSTIAKIEADSKAPIFDRYSRRLIITPTGVELYHFCKQALSLNKKIKRLMNETEQVTMVRLGASQTVGGLSFCKAITACEKHFDGIDVHTVIDNSSHIEDSVLNGELDFGFIERVPQYSDFDVEEIYTDELVVICSAGNPLWKKKTLDVTDLDGQQFIFREKGSGTRTFTEMLAESNGINLHEKWTCHSQASVMNAVASGQGISILSRNAAATRSDLKVYRLQHAHAFRKFYRIIHKDKLLNMSQTEVLNYLEKLFKNCPHGKH